MQKETMRKYCEYFKVDAQSVSTLVKLGHLTEEVMDKQVERHEFEVRARKAEHAAGVKNVEIRNAWKQANNRIDTETLFPGKEPRFILGWDGENLSSKQPEYIMVDPDQHLVTAVQIEANRYPKGKGFSKGFWSTGGATMMPNRSVVISQNQGFQFDADWADISRSHKIFGEIRQITFWDAEELQDAFLDIRDQVEDKEQAPSRQFQGIVLELPWRAKSAGFFRNFHKEEWKGAQLYLWEIETRANYARRSSSPEARFSQLLRLVKAGDVMTAEAQALHMLKAGELKPEMATEFYKQVKAAEKSKAAARGYQAATSEETVDLSQMGM